MSCTLTVVSRALTVVSCTLTVVLRALTVVSRALTVVSCALMGVSCALAVVSRALTVVSRALTVVSCALTVVGVSGGGGGRRLRGSLSVGRPGSRDGGGQQVSEPPGQRLQRAPGAAEADGPSADAGAWGAVSVLSAL